MTVKDLFEKYCTKTEEGKYLQLFCGRSVVGNKKE